MWRKIGKAACAAAAFLLAVMLSSFVTMGIYRYLEQSRPDLLFRYASDGSFSENPYFSKDLEEKFGLLEDLKKEGLQLETENVESAARSLSKYRMEAAPVLAENRTYMAYLREKDTSLSELFAFCERIALLADNLKFASRYLFFLLWVLVLYLLMRCRPALYFAMGVLCIIASLFKLSGKLAAACLFCASQQYHLFADDVIPALLEAMLTFLIFDITIASFEKVRLGKKVERLYDDLPAIECLIVLLASHPESGGVYQSDVSRLLPNFSYYARTGKRARKKAMRLIEAIERLSGPHSNREFLRDLLALRALLPAQ